MEWAVVIMVVAMVLMDEADELLMCVFFFFFKQKTAYEIGTGDWSSDVCSSDLPLEHSVPKQKTIGTTHF